MYCNKCGAALENDNQEKCTLCGSDLFWVGKSEAPIQRMPMKWHKFLVYFSIIFGAILNLFTAMSYFTGSVYEMEGVDASSVYSVLPAMKIVDMAYAIATVLFVVFSVCIWWQLKGFKVNAYKLVPIMYLVGSLIGILYQVFSIVVMIATVGIENTSGLSGVIGSIVFSAIMCVVMVVCNKIYYDKRASLFVN